MNDWQIFTGNSEPHDWELPESPKWRPFGKENDKHKSRSEIRGETFQPREEEIKMVNAALYLRRPLLITGKPGTGKSSLAYAVARELKLGEVLYWPITSRTVLKDGLYNYDAIARLQEVKQQENSSDARLQEVKQQQDPSKANNIGDYITLGPLGTALLPSKKPRILLIDEIDKSDIDLPNDLLNIFEEGRFEIPELVRLKKQLSAVDVRTAYTEKKENEKITCGNVPLVCQITNEKLTCNSLPLACKIKDGKVICDNFPLVSEITNGEVITNNFPLVILTSNGERDFPPPFLRRCLRLTMQEPKKEHLVKIIAAHLGEEIKPNDSTQLKNDALNQLVDNFIHDRKTKSLATDQLLNALFMVINGRISTKDTLIKQLLQGLGQVEEDD